MSLYYVMYCQALSIFFSLRDRADTIVKPYISLYSLFIFNSQRERELTLKSLCHTTPQETYKHLYSSMIHHRCKNIPYYYHTFLLPPLSVLVLGLRDVLFIRLLDSWTDLV